MRGGADHAIVSDGQGVEDVLEGAIVELCLGAEAGAGQGWSGQFTTVRGRGHRECEGVVQVMFGGVLQSVDQVRHLWWCVQVQIACSEGVARKAQVERVIALEDSRGVVMVEEAGEKALGVSFDAVDAFAARIVAESGTDGEYDAPFSSG